MIRVNFPGSQAEHSFLAFLNVHCPMVRATMQNYEKSPKRQNVSAIIWGVSLSLLILSEML